MSAQLDDAPPWPEGASSDKPKRGDGDAPAPGKTRAPLDWHDLAWREPPERKWAIKGWVGLGHVTLLVGSGGIGKTLLAQQTASCLAIGKSFIGDIEAERKCLMWACEDDHDELWRRQVKIAKWCDAGLTAFENLVIVPRHGLDNTMASLEYGRLMYSTLLAELSEQARDLHADVVILDNAGQLFGGSENDRHSVTAFLNALCGALQGMAIILLAHPSRSSGSEFSGSSAWENVARTRLYLGATLPGEKSDDTEPKDNVRYLARRKANYSPKDWRRMTYADGALTPDAPEAAGGIVASILTARAERCVLDGLARLASLGVHASDGKRSASFLPKLIIEYKLDEGIPARELAAALRQLRLRGSVSVEKVGWSDSNNPVKALVASTS